MAAYTSTQSGNWADPATWGGSGPPGDGDTATIAAGHVVAVDAALAVGSSSSGVGHAITVQGTSGNPGILRVAGGVTLTLRGFDKTSNTLLRVEQYGRFEPQPGSTIVLDCPSGGSMVDNRGTISAVGTASDLIVWDIPVANRSWSADRNSSQSGNVLSWYDSPGGVVCDALGHLWISNAAGTGPGSFGDSSLSFAGVSPSGILATEVASLAGVTGAGHYYVDYSLGVVWWYAASRLTSYTASYKALDAANVRRYFLSSVQASASNQCVVENCEFRYGGSTAASDEATVVVNAKRSAAVAANRLAKISGCTFAYCHRPVMLKDCQGTADDPIVVEGCTFLAYGTDTNGPAAVTLARTSTASVAIRRNRVLARAPFVAAIVTGVHTGIRIEHNHGTLGTLAYLGTTTSSMTCPGGSLSNNLFVGLSGAVDSRAANLFRGESGSPATIGGNVWSRAHRGPNASGHNSINGNVVEHCYHHGINTQASGDDVWLPGITVARNLFVTDPSGDGAHIELGYNRRHFIDGPVVEHNTCVGRAGQGGISFGDLGDNSGVHRIVGARVRSNLIHDVTAGLRRVPVDSSATNRAVVHAESCDYNAIGTADANYAGMSRQATFARSGVPYNADGSRSVLGVALFDPSYSAPQESGRHLALAVNSATDITLAWGGGTPVQLVLATGTATAGAAATLTDSGASFPTARNNASCPHGHWIKITSGTGAGQVRAITNSTATVLTVAPAWTTTPDATSQYAIVLGEVRLADSGGSESVSAGVDARALPGSSATDTGITIEHRGLTGVDPQFADPARSLRAFGPTVGVAATDEAVLAWVAADPEARIPAVRDWIFAGFAPTNAALQAAHDSEAGGWIGAVEGSVPGPSPSSSRRRAATVSGFGSGGIY